MNTTSIGFVYKTMVTDKRFDIIERALRQRDLPQDYVLVDERGRPEPIAYAAARLGATHVLRYMIQTYGAYMDTTMQHYPSPLHVAIFHGREKEALLLINEMPGIKVDPRIVKGRPTEIGLAVETGLLSVVKKLVDKGADVNAPWHSFQDTISHPLHMAIHKNQEEVALYLIDAGADIHKASSPSGLTSMMMAAKNGLLSVVKKLVHKGADVNALWHGSHDTISHPLHMAIHQKHEEVALYLIDAGANIHEALPSGLTSLMMAAKNGLLSVVKKLVHKGVDVNALWHGSHDTISHPLHMAIHQKHDEVALYLIDAGANIHEALPSGFTPLIMAAENGLLSVVKKLVHKGADVNALWHGYPIKSHPLHMAIRHKHEKVALYLATAVVNANTQCTAMPCVGLEEFSVFSRIAEARAVAVVSGLAFFSAIAMILWRVIAACRAADRTRKLRGGRRRRRRHHRRDPSLPERGAPPPQGVTWASIVNGDDEDADADAPDDLRCPISNELLEDPVLLVADGNTYSRQSIEAHFLFRKSRGLPLTAPLTNAEIRSAESAFLVPNLALLRLVVLYKDAKSCSAT
jgi:ankyrin repeat protein